MKLKINIQIIASLILLVSSCSFDEGSNSRSVASLGDSVDEDSLEIVETKEDGVLEIISSDMLEYEKIVADAQTGPRQDSIMDEAIVDKDHREEIVREVNTIINSENKFEEYIVQEGDTLMILAFRFYRDVFMWRQIASWNEESLKSSAEISPGDRLRMKVIDLGADIWQPTGNPYLINVGDTLVGISRNVYSGRSRYWRDIWSNNPLLIKNPDIIYAGFTLYYLPIEEIRSNKKREMASKQ